MFLRTRGKHARPSKTAPIAVAGGMSAAFFLADGASPASAAAPDSEWDRLAQCESGGNWSINTGNGYYGGLQFNLQTWRGVGGQGRPDQNSRAEQIKRANILHDSRGFQPWPACSRKLGLRGGQAGPAQDSAEPVQQAAPEPVRETAETAQTTRTAERASRSRRTAPVVKAAPVFTGKYQASRRARVVVALATTTPPRFDGHVLSTADVETYRIAVKHWQRRMAARGWSIDVDGHFGAQSASVAQRFAEQKGLAAGQPGTVDKTVWDAAWQLEVS